ncbi:hypothetical protein [Burkholderia stagnalis]|uniref:hypothetical protein n=1 Tax=Burkholderia stagnalis TaxID=1503054 RepID=UPI0009BDF8E5|nr:hypothetical protein [Burkholderia stagnalis]
MRIFLDTNVWSYIADQQAEFDLGAAARASRVEVIVSPGVVDEIRRIPDAAARQRALNAVTLPQWKRLMPEAYSECAEIKAEIRRLRPEWMIPNPKTCEVNRLRYDWVRRSGGFWEHARKGVEPQPTDESVRAEREARLAREESYAIRKRLAHEAKPMGETHLQHVAGVPEEGTPGWAGGPVEYWRMPSLHIFRAEIEIYASPFREWLDNEVDIWAMLATPASMNRLWLHELDPALVPRQWLRGAFEFLQSWHKVTDGTPGDSRLSTHLVEADVFVTADKNMARFSERCRSEAPFPVARSVTVPGARAGVDETLRLVAAGKAN